MSVLISKTIYSKPLTIENGISTITFDENGKPCKITTQPSQQDIADAIQYFKEWKDTYDTSTDITSYKLFKDKLNKYIQLAIDALEYKQKHEELSYTE